MFELLPPFIFFRKILISEVFPAPDSAVKKGKNKIFTSDFIFILNWETDYVNKLLEWQNII